MKKTTYLITLLLPLLLSAQQGSLLLPIIENGLYGFIDTYGNKVIKPQFLKAGSFSEGMAPARVNGFYGYINTTGIFVIAPQFDYAEPFSNGLAVAYKKGIPYYINQTGNVAFAAPYQTLEPFMNGLARVTTHLNRQGYINKKGQLVIDTVYGSAGDFINGRAVVTGLNYRNDTTYLQGLETGIIDTTGKLLVPFGRYKNISDLYEGYFSAETPAEEWDTNEGYTAGDAILDIDGRELFRINYGKKGWMDGGLKGGYAKMYLHNDTSNENNYTYHGFVDKNGKLVINDTSISEATDFSYNRAFVEYYNDDNYSLINTEGHTIKANAYEQATEFINGLAVVRENYLYGIIDTNGNYVIKPTYSYIDYNSINHNYFFFSQNGKVDKEGEHLLGMAAIDGREIIPPVIDQYPSPYILDSILVCSINNRATYINMQGLTIWQQALKAPMPTCVNVDYMVRGYVYVSSPIKKQSKKQKRRMRRWESGGWGPSRNLPQKIQKRRPVATNALTVVVDTIATVDTTGGYIAYPVYIYNTTGQTIEFDAQDSRLYMKTQALNANGEWKDIEYLPGSWCGNSYHRVSLPNKQYWKINTPCYAGDIKTRLRIELKYIDPTVKSDNWEDKKTITIYSNEYTGNINPAQFWRKPGYTPYGLMDPYLD